MLPPERQAEWVDGFDKVQFFDLVNYFGIEESLKNTAACIKELADTALSEKLR